MRPTLLWILPRKGGATTYKDMMLINLEKRFSLSSRTGFNSLSTLSYLSMGGESAVGTKTGFATCNILYVFKIKFKIHNKKHPFITCTPVLKRITLRQFHHFPSLLCVRIVLLQHHPPPPPQIHGAPNS